MAFKYGIVGRIIPENRLKEQAFVVIESPFGETGIPKLLPHGTNTTTVYTLTTTI